MTRLRRVCFVAPNKVIIVASAVGVTCSLPAEPLRTGLVSGERGTVFVRGFPLTISLLVEQVADVRGNSAQKRHRKKEKKNSLTR